MVLSLCGDGVAGESSRSAAILAPATGAAVPHVRAWERVRVVRLLVASAGLLDPCAVRFHCINGGRPAA